MFHVTAFSRIPFAKKKKKKVFLAQKPVGLVYDAPGKYHSSLIPYSYLLLFVYLIGSMLGLASLTVRF